MAESRISPTYADWKALVEKDLAGAPFDKLVATTAEGLHVQPLYVDGPTPDAATRAGAARFGVCMRSDAAHVAEDIDGGADAVWLEDRDDAAHAIAQARGVRVVTRARISTLEYDDAGADAADELALALALLVADLRERAPAGDLSIRIAVGRDTFGEICKVRALRACARKVLTAAGAPEVTPSIHAVCSSRTMTQFDRWTNMLRGTTQIFAAALGGADLVTPLPFDASPHARRVARNAALVLRDESHLGRVVDPAGGSYYLDTRTDELARAAWTRFQAIEATGGIADRATKAALRARFDASWAAHAKAIAKRKEPIVGVSEYANVDEHTAPPQAYPGHRDSEAFDALRASIPPTHVTLVPLGPPSEHRARVGFATALFATAGLRVHEASSAMRPEVAVICGSDERYASEAAAKARELRAAGFAHVVLAGRPGAIEDALRAAGVDQFIYLGCDVIAVLAELTR